MLPRGASPSQNLPPLSFPLRYLHSRRIVSLMKTTAAKTLVMVAHNDGVRRGRQHQASGGYPPPAFLQHGPAEILAAYEAGWELGYSRTTRLDLLLR